MKVFSYILAISFCFTLSTLANAAVDGNELLQKCGPIEKLYDDPASLSGTEGSGVVYCLGYIDGFMETFSFQFQAQIVPGVPYCLPEETLSKKEIVMSVVEYLKNHPEELANPAGYHLFMALRQAYPCGKEEKVEAEENENAAEQSESSSELNEQ